MSLQSIAMFERNPETADAIIEILGLPTNMEWTAARVEFGHDEPATVTLTVIPSGEQVVELAKVALTPVGDPCVDRSEP